ncbi:MAG: hypothetical protein EOO41_03935 [Methanobacteriota archaeon]|nr:MAG: hypothetical protein EOO41_03935 [Euryarchaeota archaeon]
MSSRTRVVLGAARSTAAAAPTPTPADGARAALPRAESLSSPLTAEATSVAAAASVRAVESTRGGQLTSADAEAGARVAGLEAAMERLQQLLLWPFTHPDLCAACGVGMPSGTPALSHALHGVVPLCVQ